MMLKLICGQRREAGVTDMADVHVKSQGNCSLTLTFVQSSGKSEITTFISRSLKVFLFF